MFYKIFHFHRLIRIVVRCSGVLKNVVKPIIMARNLIAGPTANQEICIVDKQIFENKLRKLYHEGSENLEIITDFDWTFTKYKNNDERVCSTFIIQIY